MYKIVARDYVRNFGRRKLDYMTYLVLIATLVPLNAVHSSHISFGEINWMAGAPVILVFFDGLFHTISLTSMMYLVPLSKEQREEYIQKMCLVRMLVPVAFTLLWDIAAWCMSQFSLYVFLTQLLCVIIGAYLNATLAEGGQGAYQTRTAFGDLRGFVAAIRVACALAMWAVGVLCMYEIGRVAFCVTAGILLVVFLPIMAAVHKRWPAIRANFADYEKAFAVETAEHRW